MSRPSVATNGRLGLRAHLWGRPQCRSPSEGFRLNPYYQRTVGARFGVSRALSLSQGDVRAARDCVGPAGGSKVKHVPDLGSGHSDIRLWVWLECCFVIPRRGLDILPGLHPKAR